MTSFRFDSYEKSRPIKSE